MLRSKRNIIFLAVFIAALVVLSILLQDVFDDLQNLLDRYSGQHRLLGTLLFIALAALSVLLGPFTSAPLAPFAVGLWGAETTLLLLMGGWLIGNTFAYAIGYYLGHPLMKNAVSSARFNRWISFLSERADITILFLFRLAMPSETGYVFGILRYQFWKYFAITFFAELPFAFIIVYAGAAFLTGGWLTLALLGVAWIALIIIAFRMLDKRARAKE